LSPAIASPCLSEIKVNSHRAQEQENSSKIEKYDTAPITKLPQAQDRRDTSDNRNNSLLSLIPQAPDNLDSDDDDSDDDSDDDYVVCDLASKSDLSDQNRAFDQSGDTFNGDIEDASAHGDDENAGSSGDSCTVYDPGGISTSSVFSDTTQASTTSDDITDNSSPLSTHAPFPLNHDAADRINTRSDTNGLGNAASFGLGISSSDDRNIAYDPGGDIHNNHGHRHAYDPGGNYFDNDFSPTPRTLLSAMTPASSAAATAHTTPAASATSATASSFTIQAATTLPTTSTTVTRLSPQRTTTPSFLVRKSRKPRISSSTPRRRLQPTTTRSILQPTRRHSQAKTQTQRRSPISKTPPPPQQPQNSQH